MFKHTAEGTLKVVFQGIPGVLFVSKSTVTGKKGKGIVYTLHISPFIGIGLIIPSFLFRFGRWVCKWYLPHIGDVGDL